MARCEPLKLAACSLFTVASIAAAQEPAPAHFLGGLWLDNTREVRIAQAGNSVTAMYINPFDCDHADGIGQHSQPGRGHPY